MRSHLSLVQQIVGILVIILLLVFVISILPTSIMTLRMSRQDSIDR